MKVLGIIPARGGSKGIPRKNLVPLAGKPLIQYTFDAALASRELEAVMLSTDDPEIADLGRKAGVLVPFLRPAELATDTSSTVPVVEHAVTWQTEHTQQYPEAVMVLQPTSPLRQVWHIDAAIRLFRDADTDGVLGVTEVKEHPFDVVAFSGNKMQRVVNRPKNAIRRQDFPEYYYVNGAIYLVRTTVLMQDHTLVPPRSIPYVMDRRYSLDIDSPLDLVITESLLKLSPEELSGATTAE